MMHARMRRRLPARPMRGMALLAAGAFLLTACVSGDPTTGPGDLAIDCASDAQPTDPSQAVVRIHDYAYHPANLSVSAGTTVTWVNCEGAGNTPHTSTADDGSWDSGLIAADHGRYTRQFKSVGTFAYHCSLHPFMKGTVAVQ